MTQCELVECMHSLSFSCIPHVLRSESIYLIYKALLHISHRWEPTAHALATLCASLILVVSPERIVLSGGVMKRTILYDKVSSSQIRPCVNSSYDSALLVG